MLVCDYISVISDNEARAWTDLGLFAVIHADDAYRHCRRAYLLYDIDSRHPLLVNGGCLLYGEPGFRQFRRFAFCGSFNGFYCTFTVCFLIILEDPCIGHYPFKAGIKLEYIDGLETGKQHADKKDHRHERQCMTECPLLRINRRISSLYFILLCVLILHICSSESCFA